MHAIADLGFRYCTPIQAQALPPSLEGRNMAGQAQTGTGKTAAFLASIFTDFLRKPPPENRPNGTPRALILAPTRELVVQIIRDAEDLGKYCGFKSLAIYGGMNFERQLREVSDHPVDIVAATPGRLLDFMGRGRLNLHHVETLVIDEADRMLDMGFIPDVRKIVRSTPSREERQTMLFSATLSSEVMRLAAQWVPDPVVVEVEPDQVAVDTVEQIVYSVTARHKFDLLYNLLMQKHLTQVLVFGNRRDRSRYIADRLNASGIRCELLSGDVPQNKRMRTLDDFRAGKIPVVVATDVAGRGIHVDGISHVINFDFPYEPQDYVHRIGRTGRAGAAGIAISFACEDESFVIPEIEAFIGRRLKCIQPEPELLTPAPRVRVPSSRPAGSDRDRGGDSRRRSGGRPSSGRRPPRGR